jgi:hypothetical protein
MRIRTAKQRAQRIDLDYFKHSHGMRRSRILLSIVLPLAAVAWIGGVALAGSRKPYSAGPVSRAHAFAEQRCEVCHRTAGTDRADAVSEPFFRRHTSDGACLTCHDAPAHAVNQTPPPACSVCHLDHKGRVDLARVDDRFCVECHADLKTTHGEPAIAKSVTPFPSGHPEFAAVRPGARDPGQINFNHAAHLKDTIRGPNGPETLQCGTCHKPEVVQPSSRAKKPVSSGLMAPISYQQQCARCHPLFFDERIDRETPHDTPEKVRAFVLQALADYIAKNPADLTKADADVRRVPLNFPRPAEPPARTPQEWVGRRAAFDERILWNKTCAECHVPVDTAGQPPAAAAPVALPVYAKSNITKLWMPRAGFNHTPHLMVTCESCHAARDSARTSDVLLPSQSVCATCHAPSKGAESRCFECHRYHDWTKVRPVTSSYSLTEFK